jgi:7,8-dihydropterin-6-yl-methyl-4-(beta-D-ribofuranosyl)aminobenzene 5'-phosphate synthase
MCTDHGHDDHHEALHAAPRVFEGDAVDPIRLEPVDSLEITILVDNTYDALMADMGPARRASLAAGRGREPDPVFDGGATVDGLRAEHGFSALVTVTRGAHTHRLLFDTGVSPDGMVENMRRLDLDPGDVGAVVLSHGHFDHAGGLAGLARARRRAGLPLVLHPLAWSRRRVAVPGREPWLLPMLDPAAVAAEGFEVIERRQPSVLLDGCVLVTGEIDRTTEFEQGMPFHEAEHAGRWEPDPLILDDQALVVEVRGRGLVVLTGCGHAGAVNIARDALRLTGSASLLGLLGGFHLTGPAFEPIIAPTVEAFVEMAPELIVPAHCTGWKAQHRLAAALPDAFVPNAVGTTFRLDAAAA